MHLEQRHLLLAAVAVCFVALASSLSHHLSEKDESVAALSIAERRAASRVADDLIVASALLAAERGLVLAVLSAPDPIDATREHALRERRLLADGAMSAVKKHLQELPSTDVLVRVVARIDAAYETTLLHRSEVDQDIHKLGLQRGAHTDFRAFQVSTALISGLQELLRAIHAELRTTDPTIAAWLEVQELSLEMAEHAGRERALIAVFLSAAGKTANARLGPAEYNRDKVFRIWAQIRSSLAALAPPQRMTEQASLVEQRYFSPHSQMRRILLSPQPNGQPLSALEWFQQATLGIDAMIDFSREAGATAAQGPSRNT